MMQGIKNPCFNCGGRGEIVASGIFSTFDGKRLVSRDPQDEQVYECPVCEGTGHADAAFEREMVR